MLHARTLATTTTGLVLAIVIGAVAVSGCATRDLDDRTLYVQLGSARGLDALVDRLLREMATSDRVAPHFRKTDIARFRRQLTAHLCQLADGPCSYDGASIREVHRGMAISAGDFNALVECLIRAMDSLAIPTATQNQLLALLAPLQTEVVEGASPWGLPFVAGRP